MHKTRITATDILTAREINALARTWDIGTLATRQDVERTIETHGADVAALYFRSELIDVPMSEAVTL